jgi:hypothetical protein
METTDTIRCVFDVCEWREAKKLRVVSRFVNKCSPPTHILVANSTHSIFVYMGTVGYGVVCKNGRMVEDGTTYRSGNYTGKIGSATFANGVRMGVELIPDIGGGYDFRYYRGNIIVANGVCDDDNVIVRWLAPDIGCRQVTLGGNRFDDLKSAIISAEKRRAKIRSKPSA